MKWEIIVIALFWTIYLPLSFLIWAQTSTYLTPLFFLLGVGIAFTALFLGGSLLVRSIQQKWAKKRYEKVDEEKMAILEELQEEEAREEEKREVELEEPTIPPETASAPQNEELPLSDEKNELN